MRFRRKRRVRRTEENDFASRSFPVVRRSLGALLLRAAFFVANVDNPNSESTNAPQRTRADLQEPKQRWILRAWTRFGTFLFRPCRFASLDLSARSDHRHKFFPRNIDGPMTKSAIEALRERAY